MDLSHPLMRGAVLLGLGQSHHSLRYRDESDKGNHGVLVGYTGAGNTPADRWERRLGRPSLGFQTAGDYVSLPVSFSSETFTVALWASGFEYGKSYVIGDSGAAPYSRFLLGAADGVGDEVIIWIGDGSTYGMLGTPFFKTKCAELHHFAATRQFGATPRMYVDGVEGVVTGTSTKTATVSWRIAPQGYRPFGGLASCRVIDPCLWTRCLASAEINMLADPSNVMLSGAIREPRPRRNIAGWRPSVGVRYGGALRAGCSGGIGVRRGGALRGA
jgi:hypothetical protein